MENDQGFGKHQELIDNQYDGDASQMYSQNNRAPNFDCAMEALLSIQSLKKDVSQNPSNEVGDYQVATFTIESIETQQPPAEDGKAESALVEGGRVGYFQRLPTRSDVEPPFPERKGWDNTVEMIAAILGCYIEQITPQILNAVYAGGGGEVKGRLVGVQTEVDRYISDKALRDAGTSWEDAPKDKRGISYPADFYAVDQETGERVTRREIQDVMADL